MGVSMTESQRRALVWAALGLTGATGAYEIASVTSKAVPPLPDKVHTLSLATSIMMALGSMIGGISSTARETYYKLGYLQGVQDREERTTVTRFRRQDRGIR